VGLILTNGVHQVVPLVQIRVVLSSSDLRLPDGALPAGYLSGVDAGRAIVIAGLCRDRHSLRAVNMAEIHRVRAGITASVHVELGAILKGVFDGVRIEVLVDPGFAAWVGAVV